MPRKAVLHEQDYAVSEGPVRLTVVVGERQFGSSLVFVDDELIATGIVEDLPLGDGKKLIGKTAAVYTLVTDIRDNTDEMAVTWILDGGRKRSGKTEKGKPAKNFGSQMFKALIHFTSA